MLKSEKAKTSATVIGFFLLLLAIGFFSGYLAIFTGLVSIFLISLGIFPKTTEKTVKIALKSVKWILTAFKRSIYEIFYAAAKGIEDAKKDSSKSNP